MYADKRACTQVGGRPNLCAVRKPVDCRKIGRLCAVPPGDALGCIRTAFLHTVHSKAASSHDSSTMRHAGLPRGQAVQSVWLGTARSRPGGSDPNEKPMWYAWGKDTMKSRAFCTSLTTRTPMLQQSAVPIEWRPSKPITDIAPADTMAQQSAGLCSQGGMNTTFITRRTGCEPEHRATFDRVDY
jgi:hypothetical protein